MTNGYTLFGVDLSNGTTLWQVNITDLSSFTFVKSLSKAIVTYQIGMMLHVYAIEVFTGEKTEWSALNNTNTSELQWFYDVSNKMVVAVVSNYSDNSSFCVFDSTSGKLVARSNDPTIQ